MNVVKRVDHNTDVKKREMPTFLSEVSAKHENIAAFSVSNKNRKLKSQAKNNSVISKIRP